MLKSLLSFLFLPALLFGLHVKSTPNVATVLMSQTTTSTSTATVKKSAVATSTSTTGVNSKQATKISPAKQTPVKDVPQNKPVATSSPILPTVQATTTQTAPDLPAPDFTKINTFARAAIVNILCTTNGNELSPISGTGVVVSPDGLIMTNAHVGQYFLLKDYIKKDFVQCVIRTGSPAYPKYNAELVYISPTWVKNNATLLKSTDPKGTGENDFAFLRITSMVGGAATPTNLPFIKMDIRENIRPTEPVLLASYPAGFLGGLSILNDLNVTSAVTTIKEIYTFKENTVDLIAVPGTVVSQKGSSGGAVVDRFSTLIGIISTSSEGDTTSVRALNAITIPYINRSLQQETGMNLEQFVSQDMTAFAKKFQTTTAPNLTKLITDALSKP